jgi:hypothetical protein
MLFGLSPCFCPFLVCQRCVLLVLTERALSTHEALRPFEQVLTAKYSVPVGCLIPLKSERLAMEYNRVCVNKNRR